MSGDNVRQGVEDLLRTLRGEQAPVTDTRQSGPHPAEEARRKVTTKVFRALGLTGMPVADPNLSIEHPQDGSVVIEWDRFVVNPETGRKRMVRSGPGPNDFDPVRERVRTTVTVSHRTV